MKFWIKYGFAFEFDTARFMIFFSTSKKCFSLFFNLPFFEIEFTTKIKEKNLHLCLHFFLRKKFSFIG